MKVFYYVVWFFTAVLSSKVGVVRILLRVAVFEPSQGYGVC